MIFSATIGSFVFHLLVNGKVYRISCPREGMESAGVDAITFEFAIGPESREYVSIKCSRTLAASNTFDETYPIALILAVKRCLSDGLREFSLHTANYHQFRRDSLAHESDKVIRATLSQYLLRRYEVDFESPLSVLETVAALETEPDRILRSLHYLHKHGFVTFPWSQEIWKEIGDSENWMPVEFAITTANLEKLESLPNVHDDAAPRNVSQVADGIAVPYDFFICHASEDKAAVADPLFSALVKRGAKVWYDKFILKIGDVLSEKIDEGLVTARWGVVILSPDFFRKNWPQRELSGLVQKEVQGRKVILPVWHNVDQDFVLRKSPTLAAKLAASTDAGIDEVARQILDATDPSPVSFSIVQRWSFRNAGGMVGLGLRIVVAQDITKEALIRLNDTLKSEYSGGREILSFEYFDDREVAFDYGNRLAKVTETEAERMFGHFRAQYTYNDHSGFNQIEWNDGGKWNVIHSY